MPRRSRKKKQGNCSQKTGLQPPVSLKNRFCSQHPAYAAGYMTRVHKSSRDIRKSPVSTFHAQSISLRRHYPFQVEGFGKLHLSRRAKRVSTPADFLHTVSKTTAYKPVPRPAAFSTIRMSATNTALQGIRRFPHDSALIIFFQTEMSSRSQLFTQLSCGFRPLSAHFRPAGRSGEYLRKL